MDIFNTIAGVCSIISLILSFFTLSKVVNIEKNLNLTDNSKHNNRNKICKNTLDNNSKIVGGNEKNESNK